MNCFHFVNFCRVAIIGLVMIRYQSGAQTNSNVRESFKASPEYKAAALKLMIKEAQTYVDALRLPEKTPLAESTLKDYFVASPYVTSHFGAMGSIRSETFSYGFGKGRHLTYIQRLPQDKSKRPLSEKFKPWAIESSAVNTNAAYSMATQWLTSVFVDVNQLSRVSKVFVTPMKVLDMTTSICTVEWR